MMRQDTVRRVAQEFALRGFEGFHVGEHVTIATMRRYGLVEAAPREVVTELSLEEAAALLNEAQGWGYWECDPWYESSYQVREGRLVLVEVFREYRFVRSALEEVGIL